MDDIYIILIINDRYVRWEIVNEEACFIDIENMLKTKYKIEKCIIEMGELLINIFLNDRILDFCKKNKELTLRVTTKDKTYKLSKDIKYLEMHDEKDGKKYFNATTSFDWYVINNVNVLNGNTEIMGWDGNSSEQCVNNLEFIPNGMFNEILFLVATEGEETVEILSESSYHTQRNFMSKTQNEGFVYPCVYTTLKDDTINLMWSETNSNGHFGISKLIWSNGMASSLQIDLGGQYGLTQFAYAIVDEPENLHLIKKVMESDIFLKLINNCYLSNGDRFNRKILATFRKDFWRYFLDENNNVIEPNYDVERV